MILLTRLTLAGASVLLACGFAALQQAHDDEPEIVPRASPGATGISAQSYALIPSTRIAIVAGHDRVLRRVDTADGNVLLESEPLAGAGKLQLRGAAGDAWLTSADAIMLVDGTTLVPRFSIPWTTTSKHYSGTRDGNTLALKLDARNVQVIRVTKRGADAAFESTTIKSPTDIVATAVSPDGSQVALLSSKTVRLMTALGKPVSEIENESDADWQCVTFHGDNLLAIGAGTNESAGAVVIDIRQNKTIAQLRSSAWLPFGGNVHTIISFEDLGLLAWSVSSAGVVSAFDDKDWSEAWVVDFHGGNPGSPGVSRSPGSTRAIVLGTIRTHRRVIDMTTGERVEGDWPLSGLDSPRLVELPEPAVLGIRDGELTILR